jgi:hypothetical protein
MGAREMLKIQGGGLPPNPEKRGDMAQCKQCGEEADELLSVKVGGKNKKLCEDCADRVRAEAEVAEQSESVVQNMMGFKGRR